MRESKPGSRNLASPRYAGEVIIPARKRRHGKGFTPERAIPWGQVNTGSALLDRYDGLTPAVMAEGIFGEVRRVQRRPKRADGSRGRPVGPAYLEIEEGQRLAQRGDCEAEDLARRTVAQALADGEFVHKGRHIRLVPTGTGAIRTIPDKGAILKWASVEDLVQAIATGAF